MIKINNKINDLNQFTFHLFIFLEKIIYLFQSYVIKNERKYNGILIITIRSIYS